LKKHEVSYTLNEHERCIAEEDRNVLGMEDFESNLLKYHYFCPNLPKFNQFCPQIFARCGCIPCILQLLRHWNSICSKHCRR